MKFKVHICVFLKSIAKAFLLFVIVLFCFHKKLQAQAAIDNTTQDIILHRVIHTANTADINTNSFYQHLHTLFKTSKESFSVIINGDLIKRGVSASESGADSVKIRTLLSTVSGFPQGQAIVLPGDRDWNHSGKNGIKTVEILEKLIKSFNLSNVQWAIEKGCPGPKVFSLNNNLILVAINTQWWNHPFHKPQPADAICNISTEDDFLEELQDILDENEDKNILIAGHFPLVSTGEYGGHIPLKMHLFPLTSYNKNLYFPMPVVGSFYAAYRQNIGTSKDIINKRYDSFRHKLQSILSDHNNLIYLSGHERNLQIMQENTNYFINSGSPQKADYASKKSKVDFSRAIPGLIEILYFESGKVVAQVYNWNAKEGFLLCYTQSLFQSACNLQSNTIPVNYAYVPCEEGQKVAVHSIAQNDLELISLEHLDEQRTKVPVIAGSEYKVGPLKKLIWGKHYRDTWVAEVQVPYLDLDTAFNGLSAFKKGGGRQTKSLQFKTPDGKQYVFRSVNKDPSKALNYQLRETIIGRVVRDQTTTQHPYGAMIADKMLNELDILHAHPQLYVLPDDAKLGPFRSEFANMLGMLEEKPSVVKKENKGFAGAQKILKSYELFRELYNSPQAKVDQTQFARARMFDILVGDWGKHEDNWKWAAFNQQNGIIYKPIPRDRDHVFSRWDGLVPWLADRKWAKPSGENFGYRIKDIRSLTWQSRHLDRFIATELTQADWLKAAQTIQRSITEEVIESAAANIPIEVQSLSADELKNKLQSRLKDLDKYALDYYKLLAKQVDVIGSNKEDFFDIKRNNDGSVKVSVYWINKSANDEQPLYQRIFYPWETKEIRLYGLKGKDVFTVTGESKKSIRLRIISGPGNDKIEERSLVHSGRKKTWIYEQSPKAEIELGEEGKIIKHWNQAVYNYDRTAFTYPTYLPSPYISYNQYNGLELSMGIEFTRQKFGKQDYSIRHNFRVSATTQANFVFKYTSRFRHVIRKWDIELEGIYARPDNYNFFFGSGNQTIKDDARFDNEYYVTRFNRYGLGTSLIQDFWKRSSFSWKASYERYEGVIDENTILSGERSFFGIAPLHMLESEVKLDLDFRDNPALPGKGMRLWISHQNGIITNNNNTNYGITSAFVEHYATIHIKFPITLGLKAGAGDSYGSIPFYKQLSLGQLNDLRGYVRHRFTGDGKLFINSELRLQLLDVKTSVVPIKLGVKGFYDSGRVYVNKEYSSNWHKGYGGGMYIVPLDKRFTCSASVAFSKEETAFFLISLGKVF